jgi:nicotinate phosphoribosyltransferase
MRDVIGRADEDLPGRPLLAPVMRGGKRLPAGRVDLDEARAYAREQTGRLPERVRAIDKADPPYPVAVSEALAAYQEDVKEEVAGNA